MKFFAKANGTKKGEVYIYEAIGESWFGGITAKSFMESMKAIANVETLDIYVNSPGGNVFDGIAIYNQIQRHPAATKVIHIDGIAASIASIIALAGTERRIAANGMVMIHDPWGGSVGTAADMRKVAESLDKVRDVLLNTYIERTTASKADLDTWMTAETWMDADEAIKHGFATSKTSEKALKAEFPMLANFGKVPDALKASGSKDLRVRQAHMQQRANQIRGQSRANA